MRQGDYKAASVTPPYGKAKLNLYNLATDPGETTDLASSSPQILTRLRTVWDAYAKEVNIVPGEE
jgi:hypothetical protein